MELTGILQTKKFFLYRAGIDIDDVLVRGFRIGIDRYL